MSSSNPGARSGRFRIFGLRAGARGCPPVRPYKTRAQALSPEARGKTRPNEEPHNKTKGAAKLAGQQHLNNQLSPGGSALTLTPRRW